MNIVRDVMTADVIRLNPSNRVKTAIILMKGHSIGGLPVLEDDRIVGMLDYQDVLGKPNDVPVESIMTREFVTIPPDMPVSDAADLMGKVGASRLVVIEAGRLAGIVTPGDLLPEVGKSFDPMTGLPRADAMRDWGINALRQGIEVTVIFIDLNDFGQFNKKYGHIIGDKVLRHMAEILRSSVDSDRELLCRYAGDEFAIVTSRNNAESQEFIDQLYEKIGSTHDPEIPEPVLGSIGMYGGKRTKERETVHYEATLDNLINLASKACIAAKPKKSPTTVPEGTPLAATPKAPDLVPVREKRLKIQGLNFSWGEDSTATAEVELANNGEAIKKAYSGFTLGHNALRLVAEATALAINEFLPSPGYGVVTESVNVISGGQGSDIVLAIAVVVTPQKQVRVSGSAIASSDPYRAAAAALLDAVNREIANLL